MSKLIITELKLWGCSSIVCAVAENQKIMELRLEAAGKKSILNNIYVGQIEKIAQNIQAAFGALWGRTYRISAPCSAGTGDFTAGRKGNAPLRAGDELLVQVSRDAMKGKLPALTTNLNFPGKYLVLTTGNRKIGFPESLQRKKAVF